MNNIHSDNSFLLHSGSNADLYKLDSDNPIIVKILKREHINNPIILNRFQKENAVLKNISFDFTPKLINVIINSNTPYYAYEYIDGDCLGKIITNNAKLNITPLKILKKILKVISKISAAGIVHSDISPDNILLDNNLDIHLIDFGSSDILTNANMNTSTWIAKHAYCSPEQAQGLPWSFQSDLFQTGLLFYELLTGRRYNNGVGKQTLAMASNPGKPILENIDSKYHQLLTTLLEPRTEDRCANAKEALNLLDLI